MFKVMLANFALTTVGDLIRRQVFKDAVPDTMVEFDGNLEQFDAEMVRVGAKIINDPASRVWLYVDPKSSDTVGIRMRWPNRQYCYIIK